VTGNAQTAGVDKTVFGGKTVTIQSTRTKLALLPMLGRESWMMPQRRESCFRPPSLESRDTTFIAVKHFFNRGLNASVLE